MAIDHPETRPPEGNLAPLVPTSGAMDEIRDLLFGDVQRAQDERIGQLQRELETERSRTEALEKRLSELEQRSSGANRRHAALAVRSVKQDSRLDELSARNDAISDRIDNLSDVLADVDAGVDAMAGDLTRKLSDLDETPWGTLRRAIAAVAYRLTRLESRTGKPDDE